MRRCFASIPIFAKLARATTEAPTAEECVTAHLQRLLNTRRGACLCNPDYGLIDLVDLLACLPHSAERIGQRIAQCIRQGEPRLRVHHVTLAHDAPRHQLQFAIEASLHSQVHGAACAKPLRLSARLDGHGRVAVGS